MKEILQKTSSEAQSEAEQASALYRKRLKYIGLSLLVMLGLGGLGWWVIWPKVRVWQQNRGLAEAESYERHGDYRRALLALEQTIQLYPQNLEAKRRLADFLERLGQRQAIEVWKGLALTAPEDPRHLLGLAKAALRFGDVRMAQEALDRVRKAGQVNADYHRLSAGVALVARDNVALEAALTELVKAEPSNLRIQLNLAIVMIHTDDPAKVEQGRAKLVELAASDSLRIRAVVELLNDMARRWPRPSIERVAAFEVLARTLTPARGPRLDGSKQDDPVERLLAFAMRQPAPVPEDAGALLSWMILNGRAAAGFEWLESLPAETRQSPVLTAAGSEAALQIQDWPRLRQLLLAGAWGNVPPGAINAAFALRDNRRGGQTDRTQWNAVVDACQTSLPSLRAILRLTEAWRWPDEQRQVLFAITRAFAAETWAWRQLISMALAQGDADQVWQIYQRWSRAVPGDFIVQVETAIMGNLLQQKGAPGPVATTELMRMQANNAGATVAHALALWRARRTEEAVTLLGNLSPTAFAEPRYAMAYGLILADAGRARESERFLDRASVERLLPAELLFVEQARARNRLRLGATP